MTFTENFRRRNKKLRVLMTTDTVSAAWDHTIQLISELSNRDLSITLMSLGTLPSKAQIKQLDEAGNVELMPTPFKPEWARDSEADVEASTRFLEDTALHVRPHVLHSHQFCFANANLRIPKLVSVQGDLISKRSWEGISLDPDSDSDPFLENYRTMVRGSLARADLLVCSSAFTAYNLRRFFNPAIRNIRVVYNGIQVPIATLNSVRKRRMAVVVMRGWDGNRKMSMILHTARMMPEMQFVIINPRMDSMNEQSCGDIPRNVKIVRRAQDKWLWDMLHDAALFISPTVYDPLATEPLKAATSNCALVLCDSPSTREIWEDGALYFDPEEPASLFEKLADVAEKPNTICRYSVMARYRAFKFYSAERMAKQYAEIYESLCTHAHKQMLRGHTLPRS